MSLRDWSSDVCSSDLFASRLASATLTKKWNDALAKRDAKALDPLYAKSVRLYTRSEERRVGKECRARVPLRPYNVNNTFRHHSMNHNNITRVSYYIIK